MREGVHDGAQRIHLRADARPPVKPALRPLEPARGAVDSLEARLDAARVDLRRGGADGARAGGGGGDGGGADPGVDALVRVRGNLGCRTKPAEQIALERLLVDVALVVVTAVLEAGFAVPFPDDLGVVGEELALDGAEQAVDAGFPRFLFGALRHVVHEGGALEEHADVVGPDVRTGIVAAHVRRHVKVRAVLDVVLVRDQVDGALPVPGAGCPLAVGAVAGEAREARAEVEEEAVGDTVL